MKRLAIVAHFDPDGKVASYFERTLQQVAAVFDTVIITSTAPLTDQARATLASYGTLVERRNYGQDFYGWKEVLDQILDAQDFDELLLTNDTYVGFMTPLPTMLETMEDKDFEYWGITAHERFFPHIQCYFAYFTKPVIQSQAFKTFWQDLKPAKNRMDAIYSQEVGLNRVLQEAGFKHGTFFQPTPQQKLLGEKRIAHWQHTRSHEWPERFRQKKQEPYNAIIANADAALNDGQLPLIKIDTLRYDPYWLNSNRLLTLCEKAYPETFAGVRDYLARTSGAYVGRPYENKRSHTLPLFQQLRIGYKK